jgi:hypothetical protein|tara:strand:- start:1843 stop:2271 length:429 start_codon:yes stop_codon:yes gene_type:complete
MDVFKQCVFKLAILWKIQRLTGGYTRRGSIRTRFNQDQDNEYQAAGSLNEETRLLDPNNVHIKYIGGVISTHDLPSFRRFIIRVTRCQVFVHAFDLHTHAEDQIIGDDYAKKKSIFVLAYQQGNILEKKIEKICSSFSGTVF